MATDSPDGPQSETIAVRLNWEDRPGLPFAYADTMFVRLENGVFQLTFGRSMPPLRVQLAEEERAQLATEGVQMDIVARVVVPANRMAAMLDNIHSVHDRLDQLLAAEREAMENPQGADDDSE
ncbi:MAG: hypothetical protein O3C10_11270 [Chloroflexi bacterium]|nr:hypothetical protein [Chloroflexota bacterium]